LAADRPAFAANIRARRGSRAFFSKTRILPDTAPPPDMAPHPRNADSAVAMNKFNREKPDRAEKSRNFIAYADRLEMDRFLAQPEFRIKSHRQVLQSTFSFFSAPPDKVCKFFVTKRLPEIYDTIEQLVSAVRIIFPRNDQNRNEKLREYSVFSYNVLNVIRHWNIARIATLIGHFQQYSRNVYITDLKPLTRLIYRPIIILDAVNAGQHIPIILRNLYGLILAKTGKPVLTKKQEKIIQDLTYQYEKISREICYELYPLLMKMLCHKWHDYNTFFTGYHEKICEFLEIQESQCIIPPEQIDRVVANIDEITDADKEVSAKNTGGEDEAAGERLEKQKLEKTMKSGLETLEILFPGSGWNQPENFPDFYQYFVYVFDFKKGVDHIHPENPVLQSFILAQILQDLFYGWRSMMSRTHSPLARLITEWQKECEALLNHDYLKLLTEYYNYFSIATQFRSKDYGQKIIGEINSFTKFSLFPFYNYAIPNNIGLRQDGRGKLWDKIQALYHELDRIASMPNEAAYINKRSAPFVFDVPNPVSRRLFSLFEKEARSNEILITVTHEIAAVFHYLTNCPDSWAYSAEHYKKIFRSRSSTGIIPAKRQYQDLNPDNTFRNSIEKLRWQANEKFNKVISKSRGVK
jgi:hypothetical protein